VRRPPREGGSLFRVVRMPIVDGRHTHLHVVQNLRDHEAWDATASEKRRAPKLFRLAPCLKRLVNTALHRTDHLLNADG